MSFLSKYFNWLQKDVPTGEVEKYPEINENGETSVKGIFIIGDLTGIPLLKLAAESGKKIIEQFSSDSEFQKLRQSNNDKNIYDVIIVGAGPAGISAGLEASKKNFSFKILESAKKFNTIINFPKGKPIIAAPDDYQQQSDLKINDGVKESLIQELNEQIKNLDLPIKEGVMVEKIEKEGNHFNLVTSNGNYKSLRVILAIGKSGNARMLNVPGEDLPKVYNRLIDPNDAKGEDVLVVGGGDSALETAIAVSHCAKSVTVSYRKPAFARPKQQNEQKLKELVEQGKIKLLLETNVKEVKENSVVLLDKNKKEIEIPNSMVFTMIGKELPIQFFKRSNIKMEGELSLTSKLQFALLLLFAGVLYFGKSSEDYYEKFFGKLDSWGAVFGSLFTSEFWSKFFSLPSVILIDLFNNSKVWSVAKYINAFIAYISLIGFVLLGVYLLYKFLKDYLPQIKFNWQTFKYFYFISIGIFFAFVFFGGRYFGVEVLGKPQSFWYTGLYSLTILLFGLRRMKMKPTKYIKYQTWTLILIQALPLFILPEFVFPFLGKIGALGGKDGFMLTQVFPGESYWRSYGFILAWPLFLSNMYSSSPTAFWVVFSFIQTFVFIPYIVYRWGKGAYCGWICSCGALAETLGDEYRTLAPHGPKAKKWENFGQWALLAAFVVTGLKLLSGLYDFNIPIINEKVSYTANFLHNFYYIGIDVIFAGVLGVGVYFFLSGRVWCRFGCPLAAWMHMVSRFSRYRIFSDKKKCISCNICTKVCHMGIDVMNFANKGIPMNDVECVRCSACVVNCPTEVLYFGSLPEADTNNELYKNIELPVLNKNDWRSGL
ncbi:Thioredoxin reductase [Ignavibacterium album JCM 16511]|uniref:Thioredoxin reductase n=1 Tax=Ignavibacterium album (strain DSM 19864 / JCM 16511 / NBRC 101810 / Mat9-16) TaxID=945713 RepID=I0AL25_IGNAJ|nr:NAD(P)-binding domain-containing protein [Ignavibacterium album]AFH49682.1 Thioredoxin reductase [Ignavibacterium album JCM 16511]